MKFEEAELDQGLKAYNAPDFDQVALKFVLDDCIQNQLFSQIQKMVNPDGYGLIDGGKWVVMVRNLQDWHKPLYKDWPTEARFLVIVDRKAEQKPPLNHYYEQRSLHYWVRVAIRGMKKSSLEHIQEINNIIETSEGCYDLPPYVTRTGAIQVSGWKTAAEKQLVMGIISKNLADDYQERIDTGNVITMVFVFLNGDKHPPDHFMQKYRDDLIENFNEADLSEVFVRCLWINQDGSAREIDEI